tara:strand:+ start:910 stop:1275 length:366 start_codon:yes stop_codon:yes gene_type:complete
MFSHYLQKGEEMGKKRRIISSPKFAAKFKNHPVNLERNNVTEEEVQPEQPISKAVEPVVEEKNTETVLSKEIQEKVDKPVDTAKKTKKVQKPATLKAAPKTPSQTGKQKSTVKKTINKLTE